MSWWLNAWGNRVASHFVCVARVVCSRFSAHFPVRAEHCGIVAVALKAMQAAQTGCGVRPRRDWLQTAPISAILLLTAAEWRCLADAWAKKPCVPDKVRKRRLTNAVQVRRYIAFRASTTAAWRRASPSRESISSFMALSLFPAPLHRPMHSPGGEYSCRCTAGGKTLNNR